MVTAKFRAFRDFAPSYFDDIYVHRCASPSQSDIDVHRGHHRQVFEVLRANALYANLAKCMLGVDEIPVLGDLVGVNGCRADPEKIKAISEWPIPFSDKDLRRWLGLATYLHKYSQNFANISQPLFRFSSRTLLGFGIPLVSRPSKASKPTRFWRSRASTNLSPSSATPRNLQFCCLMQLDASGRPRPVSYQSLQLHPAERGYPVHDLELLSM
ncbi:hypothetical protein AaE_000074, partial [Aphanomyces astaci]